MAEHRPLSAAPDLLVGRHFFCYRGERTESLPLKQMNDTMAGRGGKKLARPDHLQRAAYEKMKLRLPFVIDPYWKYLWPFSRFRATLGLPPHSPVPLHSETR